MSVTSLQNCHQSWENKQEQTSGACQSVKNTQYSVLIMVQQTDKMLHRDNHVPPGNRTPQDPLNR